MFGVPETSNEKGTQTYPQSPRARALRECLVQVRYVAAASRPGKRRLWVSRELQPNGTRAQRLSLGFGVYPSCGTPWQNIGTSEAGRFGIDPAQQKPGKPDFKLLVFNGFEPYRPPRQTRTDKQFVFSPGDDAGGINPTPHHLGVVQLLYSATIGPNRMAIKFTPDNAFQGPHGDVAG